jgi:hypothetical protein
LELAWQLLAHGEIWTGFVAQSSLFHPDYMANFFSRSSTMAPAAISAGGTTFRQHTLGLEARTQ